MEILNWNKLIVIPLLLIFYGCGQQTMKDEGLETKSISEAGTSSTGNSGEDFIFVSSVPANGDSSVAVDSNITLNFNENVRWKELGTGTWTTSYTSSGSGSGYCSTTPLNEQLVQISSDNFNLCRYFNFTVSESSITIDPKSNLDSGTSYTIKIFRKSLSQGYELQDENGKQLEMEYEINFST